ncbi:MAG TPA: CxxxxCH/CxxCH domain-containing protein [Anaeromyxobacter sp.]
MDRVLSSVARRLAPLAALALLAPGCDRARPFASSGTPECERCHGGNGSAAPPRTATGLTATSVRGVGAHRRHLEPGPGGVRAALPCETCHVVPASVEGHVDGVAEVRFLDPAPAGGAGARWDPATGRCENVYCHGATLRDGTRGTATAPLWTVVDGSQATCGSCHRAPPASHAAYADAGNCHRCHPGTVRADGTIDVAAGQHIDGATPVPAACDACHLAPPDTGAHRAHANVADPATLAYGGLEIGVGLSPSGAPAYVFGCGYCHPLDPARHRDGTLDVDVAPGGAGLKALNDPAAAWAPASGTCSGVYCHGATLRASSRGASTAPVWTVVDGTQRTCGSCHASPPGSHAGYPSASSCQLCHPATVRPDGTIDVPGMKHVDGRVEAPAGIGCTACHGAPPATGAHRVHSNPPDPAAIAYGGLSVLEDVSPSGGPAYDFGCGHCHPVDPARHAALAPAAQVELVPPPAPVAGDEVKARNDPGATFDPTAKTCSGVYCHSSGQPPGAALAFATTPAWTAAPGALGCGGCHGNPPRYASGGAGAADANGHLVLADDGWESGHFQGLPGYWHPGSSKHGGNFGVNDDAAPITCQTCHADTVDPAAAGPSGFYWLDTTGSYQLPGGDASRLGSGWYARLQCTACHDGAIAPVGAGRVLPLRHVNGKREVVFDGRAALPAIAWLPGSPSTPTRPYWVTNAQPLVTIPDPTIPDAIMEGATLSLHLESARYDVATKTCTSVACHLAQIQVTWGAPHGSGLPTGSNANCKACHGL